MFTISQYLQLGRCMFPLHMSNETALLHAIRILGCHDRYETVEALHLKVLWKSTSNLLASDRKHG
jgi:hypothetical protein